MKLISFHQEGDMLYKKLSGLLFVLSLCFIITGLAEAGKGGHPEQFPYPNEAAFYIDSKTNCRIAAHEDGQFEVFFPSSLTMGSIKPALTADGIDIYLYDPTTMSNSAKKLASTQTSYLYITFGSDDPQVSRSSIIASADAKKATASVKISDSALDEISEPANIRPQSSSDFRGMLAGSGFKLKLGWWTATCSAKRILE